MYTIRNIEMYKPSDFSQYGLSYLKSGWPKIFSLQSDQQLHKTIHETNEGMLCLKSQLSFRKQTIENIVLTQCPSLLLKVNLKVELYNKI